METSPTEQIEEEPIPSMTLLDKIRSVQQDILYVQKTGFNSFNKYSYAKEEDYLGQIKPILGKHGLVILSTIQEDSIERYTHKNKDGREVNATSARVKMLFTISDGKDEYVCSFIGYAQDDGDKALYKAITGCVKYFLSKEFLIATGDDPEEEEQKTSKTPIKKPSKEVSPDLRKMNDLAKKLGMSTQGEIEAFSDLKLVTSNLPEIISRLETEIESRKN